MGLARSTRGGVAILTGGCATALLLAATPLPLGVACFAVVAVGLMTLEAYRRIALAIGPRAVRGLALGAEGAVEVLFDGGAMRAGKLRAGSFVAPWLTVVRWRPERGWWDRTVLVLPDMLDEERFRELRVALRWA